MAGERGMVRRERLFLTQNTLPIFDRLLDILDGIPGEVRSRVTSPFFYAGLATKYESERLTEDERDNLPERINELRPARFDNWLSEREWIPVTMETASQPRRRLPGADRCASIVISNHIYRLLPLRTTHANESGWIQMNQGLGQQPGHSYGGYKRSGIGREFSLEGMLDSFTQRKNVTVNLNTPAR